MCDYSLTNVKSRPAQVGDKLVVHSFGTGTKGFRAIEDVPAEHNAGAFNCTAVCLLPGTEIAFTDPPKTALPWWYKTLAGIMTTLEATEHKVAIFRQINKDEPHRHHDAIEMPDGKIVLLTGLDEGQTATVLQLPASPKTEQEAQDQKRLEVVA